MSELEDALMDSARYDRIKKFVADKTLPAPLCDDLVWFLDQVDELSEELDMARAVGRHAPTLPNSFTAHGPGSDHWIALSESGKPKSIKGCGCRLNGECAIKGDWDKGESSSCDECRFQKKISD